MSKVSSVPIFFVPEYRLTLTRIWTWLQVWLLWLWTSREVIWISEMMAVATLWHTFYNSDHVRAYISDDIEHRAIFGPFKKGSKFPYLAIHNSPKTR